MTISMDKKYRTRDGRIVRILCVDASHSEYPVVALVPRYSDGIEDAIKFTSDGKFLSASSGISEDPRDLVEVSPYDDFNWMN